VLISGSFQPCGTIGAWLEPSSDRTWPQRRHWRRRVVPFVWNYRPIDSLRKVVPGTPRSNRFVTSLKCRAARRDPARANNHTIRVYNALTGRLLRTYEFPTAGFINDLVITRNAVYATDSNNAQLAVVPLGRFGRLPAPSAATLLPLGGEFVLASGFNNNGIVARNGWLIAVQSKTGILYRIDPKTGDARKIVTTYVATNGDGLALRNGKLYVVRNQNNLVAVLNLGSDLLSATLVGEITSPGNLEVPTAATFALDKLWVVNARFGTPNPETADYWITRLPTSP